MFLSCKVFLYLLEILQFVKYAPKLCKVPQQVLGTWSNDILWLVKVRSSCPILPKGLQKGKPYPGSWLRKENCYLHFLISLKTFMNVGNWGILSFCWYFCRDGFVVYSLRVWKWNERWVYAINDFYYSLPKARGIYAGVNVCVCDSLDCKPVYSKN